MIINYLDALKTCFSTLTTLPILIEYEKDENCVCMFQILYAQDDVKDAEINTIEVLYKEKRDDYVVNNRTVRDIKERIQKFYNDINVLHTTQKANNTINYDFQILECSNCQMYEDDKKFINGLFNLTVRQLNRFAI